jgi:triosephosphate isomerase
MARDGEDITEQVLNDSSYTMLLISPHLEQADDSQLDVINELYEYTKDNGYAFYGLTASGEKAVNQWRDRTGAEYAFYQTDDVLLKTVIRSNPGLLLLHDGVIIQKWSHNRLPELDSSKPLHELQEGSIQEDSVARRIAMLMLWFVLPLTLLSLADRMWMWTRWLRRRKRQPSQSSQ